jgi:hypothetical protein
MVRCCNNGNDFYNGSWHLYRYGNDNSKRLYGNDNSCGNAKRGCTVANGNGKRSTHVYDFEQYLDGNRRRYVCMVGRCNNGNDFYNGSWHLYRYGNDNSKRLYGNDNGCGHAKRGCTVANGNVKRSLDVYDFEQHFDGNRWRYVCMVGRCNNGNDFYNGSWHLYRYGNDNSKRLYGNDNSCGHAKRCCTKHYSNSNGQHKMYNA